MKAIPMIRILCVISVSILLSGCSFDSNKTVVHEATEVETRSQISTQDEANTRSDEQNPVADDIIDEKIADHLNVHASISVPSKMYPSYNTKFKEFVESNIENIVWAGTNGEFQVEKDNDENFSITCGDESLIAGMGYLKYIKNDKYSYIESLIDYAREKGLIEQKDLEFSSLEIAQTETLKSLIKFEVGADFVCDEVSAASKEDLIRFQEMMKSDPDYSGFFQSGKYSEFTLTDEDAVYYFKYSFSSDGLPILGIDDPPVMSMSEDGLLARPMSAVAIYSNEGIAVIRLDGVVDRLEQGESNDTIQYQGIKDALIKKFGDVILTEDYTVTDIWLEYFPLIASDSFQKVELIPAWCCVVSIGGETDGSMAVRFNAVTGEEIA